MRARGVLTVEVLTAIGLVIAPFVLPHLGFAPNTVNRILVWGLFGLGFDILFGYTGLLSFGQSAFYGTGGMVAAYLLTRAGFPNVVAALFIGMIAAAVVGGVVGLVALRRTGIYFAMITVAIAEVFYFVEFNPLAAWTGGENGLPGVPTPTFHLGFATIHFTTGWSLYPFLALCYFIGIVIALRIVRSPVGVILRAIRRRPARHDARLHAARSLHVRHVGTACHADSDRRPWHAVRSAPRRDRVAVPAGLPAVGVPARRGVEARARSRVRSAGLLPATRHHRRHQGSQASSVAQARSRGTGTGLHAESRRGGQERRRPVACTAAAAPCVAPIHRPDSAGDRPDEALRRRDRQRRHRLLGEPRRASWNHRPERRRQDDVLQNADVRGGADVGAHRLRRPRHRRHERHRRVSARPHEKLSGEPALQSADRRGERHDRRAGRDSRQVPPRHAEESAKDSGAERTCRAQARAREPDRAPSHAGRTARVRREAQAGSRARARVVAGASSARRAARGDEPGRARRDGKASEVDRAGSHDDRHRPRHGCALRAG